MKIVLTCRPEINRSAKCLVQDEFYIRIVLFGSRVVQHVAALLDRDDDLCSRDVFIGLDSAPFLSAAAMGTEAFRSICSVDLFNSDFAVGRGFLLPAGSTTQGGLDFVVSLGFCRASVGRKYLGNMEDERFSVVFGFCCGVAVSILIRMRFPERHGDHWGLVVGGRRLD